MAQNQDGRLMIKVYPDIWSRFEEREREHRAYLDQDVNGGLLVSRHALLLGLPHGHRLATGPAGDVLLGPVQPRLPVLRGAAQVAL